MADAILVQRLIGGDAALGLLVLTVLAVLMVVATVAGVARAVRRLRAGHYDGPDSLLLLEDLDAHLDEYVAADPQLAARFDRLRDAIRDQQEGEQA